MLSKKILQLLMHQQSSIQSQGAQIRRTKSYGMEKKKGAFTVKSAYHLAVQIDSNQKAAPSNNHAHDPMWRKFWNIKAIPKAKICVWRNIQNSLPTGSNINLKGIYTNPICFWCRKHTESVEHIFWGCKFSKFAWRKIIPLMDGLFSLNRGQWTARDHWRWMEENLGTEDLEKAILVLWSLWNQRNQSIQSNQDPDFKYLTRAVNANIKEEKKRVSANLFSLSCLNPSGSESLSSHASWEPPPAGVWKLNVDASRSEMSQTSGLGWILRDSTGSPICGGLKRINSSWSIKMLEMKAILEGLKSLQSKSI